MIENNRYFNKFSLTNIDVSYVNALRRICLANISTYVIKDDDIDITTNTTRFNNEIIKQRILCIPVHILDNTDEIDGSEYLKGSQGDYKAIHPSTLDQSVDTIILKINESNKSQTTKYVTTQDIGLYKSIDDETEIQYNYSNGGKDQKVTLSSIVFPPDPITKNHIVIARLKPPVDTTLPGESLTLTAKFSLGTAKEHGGFNVVSTCAYENNVDEEKSNAQWEIKKKQLELSGVADSQLDLEEENWKLLDGRRQQYRDNKSNVFNLCIPDAYQFKIETVGVFSNIVILHKACLIMQNKCERFRTSIETNNSSHVKIAHNQNTTQPYEYTATLHDEDYTIGNPLVHYIYSKLYGKIFPIEIKTTDYETNDNDNDNDNDDNSPVKTYNYNMVPTFIGFKVPHPHIPDGIIRIIYEMSEDAEPINDNHKDILIRKLKDNTSTILKAGAMKISSDFKELNLQFNPRSK